MRRQNGHPWRERFQRAPRGWPHSPRKRRQQPAPLSPPPRVRPPSPARSGRRRTIPDDTMRPASPLVSPGIGVSGPVVSKTPPGHAIAHVAVSPPGESTVESKYSCYCLLCQVLQQGIRAMQKTGWRLKIAPSWRAATKPACAGSDERTHVSSPRRRTSLCPRQFTGVARRPEGAAFNRRLLNFCIALRRAAGLLC